MKEERGVFTFISRVRQGALSKARLFKPSLTVLLIPMINLPPFDYGH